MGRHTRLRISTDGREKGEGGVNLEISVALRLDASPRHQPPNSDFPESNRVAISTANNKHPSSRTFRRFCFAIWQLSTSQYLSAAAAHRPEMIYRTGMC